MQGNRGRDTKPEIAVRRRVHAAGLRYRVDFRPLPQLNRRADLVFTRYRIAVFIDGCFWHGCPEHHTISKSNRSFWAEKASRNRERDRQTDQILRSESWCVLRFWEHEDPAEVASQIVEMVRSAAE